MRRWRSALGFSAGSSQVTSAQMSITMASAMRAINKAGSSCLFIDR
jgi:hypothetical protein